MSTTQVDHVGTSAVTLAVAEAEWFFRTPSDPDFGIDAIIEASTDGRPNGRLIGLQIKSGASQFVNERPAGWHFYVKERHLAYWGQHSLPVVLVMVDEHKRIYWQPVRRETVRPTPTGGRVFVPKDNALDRDAFDELAKLAGPERASDRLRTQLDIELVEKLDAGVRLQLDARSSVTGRGSVRIVSHHSPYDRIERDWPWVFAEHAPDATNEVRAKAFIDALRALLPWADLRIDTESYRQAAWAEFVREHATWRAADGEYEWNEHADFDTWFAGRFDGTLAPCAIVGADRTMRWRLTLALNERGREILNEEQSDMLLDAAWSLDIADRQERSREDGEYRTAIFENMPTQFLAILFESESAEVSETLYLGAEPGDVLSDEQAAALVLEDALAQEPSSALVQLFIERFATELENGDWRITAASLDRWLSHDVTGPPPVF